MTVLLRFRLPACYSQPAPQASAPAAAPPVRQLTLSDFAPSPVDGSCEDPFGAALRKVRDSYDCALANYARASADYDSALADYARASADSLSPEALQTKKDALQTKREVADSLSPEAFRARRTTTEFWQKPLERKIRTDPSEQLLPLLVQDARKDSLLTPSAPLSADDEDRSPQRRDFSASPPGASESSGASETAKQFAETPVVKGTASGSNPPAQDPA